MGSWGRAEPRQLSSDVGLHIGTLNSLLAHPQWRNEHCARWNKKKWGRNMGRREKMNQLNQFSLWWLSVSGS